MSIDVVLEKGKTMDIPKSNRALLEMAIADSFHCENLPDMTVESKHFYKMFTAKKR